MSSKSETFPGRSRAKAPDFGGMGNPKHGPKWSRNDLPKVQTGRKHAFLNPLTRRKRIDESSDRKQKIGTQHTLTNTAHAHEHSTSSRQRAEARDSEQRLAAASRGSRQRAEARASEQKLTKCSRSERQRAEAHDSKQRAPSSERKPPTARCKGRYFFKVWGRAPPRCTGPPNSA